MISAELVRDLYLHMEWADARIWTTVLGSPAVTADKNARDRLMHIHMTQKAFLQVWQQQKLDRFQELTFPTTPALYEWVTPYYPELRQYLEVLQPAQLGDATPVPWAKYFVPAGHTTAITTLGETLLQVASHSTYHRGQLNTRLRELGTEPPLVDYIGWLWLGRPPTAWPPSDAATA